MTLAQLNLSVATPEIVLLALLCLLLIADLFAKPETRESRLMVSALTILTIVLVLVARNWSEQPQVGFSGMFVNDPMSALMKISMLIGVGMLLVLSRAYLSVRKLFSAEFVCLLLFATLGMMVMVSANHFISLYLGLELLALSTYAMVALDRDSARSTEAAMKYFILGALASGLLLYGLSMVYGATGSLDVSKVARAAQFSQGNMALLSFGIVFVVAGLAFKLGVVPFHMWVPDVYHGAPTPMTLFIGSAPKIAAFGFVLRIVGDALSGGSGDWQSMFALLAVASLLIGNVVAIAQTNLKRMLAYSTISHMGFLALAMTAATKSGYAAGLFYVITYALTAIAAFGIILLLSRQGFEAEELDDLKGLNQRSPGVALMMLFAMMSMAGIPPFVGFFAKLAVLEALLAAGFTWLVVFAVIMSVIGAFYYLRVLKLMYMDAPTDTSPIVSTGGMGALLTVNSVAILVLGLLPGIGLLGICMQAVQRSL